MNTRSGLSAPFATQLSKRLVAKSNAANGLNDPDFISDLMRSL